MMAGVRTGDLTSMSALELAEAIRSERGSSEEVIDAHLQRVDAVNGSVNAVTTVVHEEARKAARRADAAIRRGGALPPMHGVPFTAEENIDLMGTSTNRRSAGVGRRLPVA